MFFCKASHSAIRIPQSELLREDDQDRINFPNTRQHVYKRYDRFCHANCLMDTTCA
jgi:hypothetical protein